MAATPLGQGRPPSPDSEPSLGSSAHPAQGAARAGAGWSREPAPRLDDCVVSLEDGLLMVFGPEGDPLPPGALRLALSDQPDAMLALVDGAEVAAARVMAALEAQASGRLGPDEAGAEGWMLAMLGLGPQPDEMAQAVLLDEPDGGQLTAFGNELMVAMPAGGALLIADAKTRRPASEALGLFLADGTAIGIGDLIERLRSEPQTSEDLDECSLDPANDELALPDCWVQAEDDALALDFPTFGRVRLASFEGATSDGPQVSVFLPDGRAATMADLLAAVEREEANVPAYDVPADSFPTDELSTDDEPDAEQSDDPPSEVPAPYRPMDEPVHAPATEPADPASGERAGPAAVESARADGGLAGSPFPIEPAPRQVISLSAHLPTVEGVEPEQLALLVVRGVPRGGALSAGVDNGDGSWLLSPAELDHLTLTLPADALRPASLPVGAIAVTSRDGALASVSGTLRLSSTQSFGRKTFGRRSAEAVVEPPIPLAIEACVTDLEGIDAVVVRDVPRGASLSTGTYDPAIAGWVLRPAQLAGLALVPPTSGQPTECTLTILGIALRPGAPTPPRVLGRLPLTLR